MTKNYIKKLIRLAEEVRELQLKNQELELSWDTVKFNSKLDYLIGYILALKEEKQ